MVDTVSGYRFKRKRESVKKEKHWNSLDLDKRMEWAEEINPNGTFFKSVVLRSSATTVQIFILINILRYFAPFSRHFLNIFLIFFFSRCKLLMLSFSFRHFFPSGLAMLGILLLLTLCSASIGWTEHQHYDAYSIWHRSEKPTIELQIPMRWWQTFRGSPS